MLSNNCVSNAIALAFLVSPYCFAARAQIVPELETQPVSLILPPPARNNPFVNPQFAQIEEIPLDETLKVLPRIGATFQSGPDAGHGSSFGSLYAFVPFAQTPGVSTFYTEGRINFFTHDGEFGGNLRLGYRTLLPDTDLVLGGYFGADARRTEFDENFYQLGFGLDVQGEKWEISANGYIPVGSTQRKILILNSFFQGNSLLFNQLYEASMTGFDLEGGYRLWDWEGGNLYAHAGLYYLNAPNEGGYLGVRGRLTAKLNETFSLGVGLSSDDNFGTNFTFNISALFGRQGQKQSNEKVQRSILSRLGQTVRRQETIAIDRQLLSTEALNPSTGQAWRFLHVTGGASGSCTFESPCSQITEAMNLAQTGGNDIVYVDSGTNPGLNGFSILDNVQVLSTGVSQFLDLQVTSILGGTETFNTQLLGSGTGVLPLINGTTVTAGDRTTMVSMGNNSILSGFDIQSETNGVLGLNVGGWTVQQNQVTTTGNTIAGIIAFANNGGTISTATISGNSVSTSGNNARGIPAYANNGGTISTVTISGNSISTSGNNAYGIFTFANNGGTISTATISGNSVSTLGNNARGVFVTTNNGGTISTATISGNSISASGNGAYGIYAFANNGGTISTATISGNSVSTSGNNAHGIYATTYNGGTISTATISGNSISALGNNAHGIYAFADNGAISTATISGNSISTSGNGADGIFVVTNNGGTISTATISNNLIQQAGQHSVLIGTNNAADNICIAQFTGNTSSMPNFAGGGGNDLNIVTTGTVNFVDFANILLNNTGFDDIVGTPTGTPTFCP
jgi:hypothetical protein